MSRRSLRGHERRVKEKPGKAALQTSLNAVGTHSSSFLTSCLRLLECQASCWSAQGSTLADFSSHMCCGSLRTGFQLAGFAISRGKRSDESECKPGSRRRDASNENSAESAGAAAKGTATGVQLTFRFRAAFSRVSFCVFCVRVPSRVCMPNQCSIVFSECSHFLSSVFLLDSDRNRSQTWPRLLPAIPGFGKVASV